MDSTDFTYIMYNNFFFFKPLISQHLERGLNNLLKKQNKTKNPATLPMK